MTANVSNYKEQGGATWVIGDELKVADGGQLLFGETASAALLQGAGTSAAPATTAVADKNFLGYWLESSAATGDARGV